MIRTRKSCLTGFIAVSAMLLTAGCVVGPRFKKPVAPDVSGYTPAPITTTSSTPNVAGGEAQHLVEGHDIPGEWWTLFHSKPLDDLIERSLKANPDLKAAQAALIVARENMLAQRGAYYPSVTGGFSATRCEVIGRHFTCNQHQCLELQPLHAAGERFFCAGRFRSEPENRGVVASAGTASAFCPGRNPYHAERKRRRRSHSRGVIAGTD